MLLDYIRYDYAINIKEDKEPPFKPLYNLLKRELRVLRKYLK